MSSMVLEAFKELIQIESHKVVLQVWLIRARDKQGIIKAYAKYCQHRAMANLRYINER